MVARVSPQHPDTERVSSRSSGIDTWPSGEMLKALWQDQIDGVAAVRAAIGHIESAALAVVDRLCGDQGRLIYVGAGSSGVLAGLDGIELPCTFGWPEKRLDVYRADDTNNILTIETPGDDDENTARAVFEKENISNKDVVIAVSASGDTPYTCLFAELAKNRGALVVGIASNADSRLLQEADYPIHLATGPELIAGSTRLKAGTAQKTALGMFSTLVMTRLGHVHDGLLVDVAPENEKLRGRAARIVSTIAEVDEATAVSALRTTEYDVKTAVLVAKGFTQRQAQAALNESGRNLREALIRIAQA